MRNALGLASPSCATIASKARSDNYCLARKESVVYVQNALVLAFLKAY